MKTPTELQALLEKLLDGQCNQAELQELLTHFQQAGTESPLMEQILAELQDNNSVSPMVQQHVDHIVMATDVALAPFWRTQRKPPIRRIRRWIPYAAAIVLALAGTWIFWGDQMGGYQSIQVKAEDIMPPRSRATLTLDNNRTIDLNVAKTGIVVGDEIRYLDGSAVSPEADPHTARVATDLRLTTPEGSTYQVTLPDGSKVWLNAASSLKYPSRFDADKRIVHLEGEAYFEIRNTKHEIGDDGITPAGAWPFQVVSKGQTVEVHGTQFNISAYPEEETIVTTLVEGSVQVALIKDEARAQPIFLKPGYQSIAHETHIETRKVNVDAFVAWKNGVFYFEETPFPTAMNQLSRWYDIEVVYPKSIPDTYLYGEIGRDESLAAVLRIFEKSGLRFKVERYDGKNNLVVLNTH